MARKHAHKQPSPLPFAVVDACRSLGQRLAVARKRRRLTQREVARQAGLSAFTLIRIEKGVPSTEVGSVLRVLWALGLEGSFALVAEAEADTVGQTLDRARLPKRVRPGKGLLDDNF
ncbi:MAG: helix-turn-helix domain-containing protein [Deltaproteobacteria bacterium]|nr:helix-turn-helix domain-containing protein [Deltaproteobacteria bacterium]